MRNEIDIYPFWGGVYSNWYICDFEIEHVTQSSVKYMSFNCVEQYMMHEKARISNDFESMSKIIETDNPKEQKKLGCKVKNFNPTKWHSVCRNIVRKGVRAKFMSSQFMRNELEKSKGKICVEASPHDKIWGVGMSVDNPDINNMDKWNGLNFLGFIITDLRIEVFGE